MNKPEIVSRLLVGKLKLPNGWAIEKDHHMTTFAAPDGHGFFTQYTGPLVEEFALAMQPPADLREALVRVMANDGACQHISVEDEALIRAYIGPVVQEPECEHNWVSARNKVITSGEICTKCFALRAEAPPQLGTVPRKKDLLDGYAYLYLAAQRKNWHHDLPEGWEEIAFERGNYIECGIFRKPEDKLTTQDKDDWIPYHSSEPDEWLFPLIDPMFLKQE